MSWSGFNHPNNVNPPPGPPDWNWFYGMADNNEPHNVGAGVDRAPQPGPDFPLGFNPFGSGPHPFAGPWGGPWGRRHHGHGHGHGFRGRRGSCRGRGPCQRGPPPADGEPRDPHPPEEDAPPYTDAAGRDVTTATADEKTGLLAGEKDDGSPDTMRDSPADDPPEQAPGDGDDDDNDNDNAGGCGRHRHHGHRQPHGPWGGRGRRGGGRGGFFTHHHPGHHPGHHPHPHHHHPHHPHDAPSHWFAQAFGGPGDRAEEGDAPPHQPGQGAFDFRAMMRAFANHPFAQQMRAYAEQARAAARGDYNNNNTHNTANNNNSGQDDDDDADVLVPPVDVFDTGSNWTVHVALPGAKKEDVGVHWDADRSELAVSGVVHRPGDEAFLRGMVSGERRIGLFRRTVRIPPVVDGNNATNNNSHNTEEAGEKEEMVVDEEGITARMEDGVLIVVVPKLEKEWTQIRKVDIE